MEAEKPKYSRGHWLRDVLHCPAIPTSIIPVLPYRVRITLLLALTHTCVFCAGLSWWTLQSTLINLLNLAFTSLVQVFGETEPPAVPTCPGTTYIFVLDTPASSSWIFWSKTPEVSTLWAMPHTYVPVKDGHPLGNDPDQTYLDIWKNYAHCLRPQTIDEADADASVLKTFNLLRLPLCVILLVACGYILSRAWRSKEVASTGASDSLNVELTTTIAADKQHALLFPAILNGASTTTRASPGNDDLQSEIEPAREPSDQHVASSQSTTGPSRTAHEERDQDEHVSPPSTSSHGETSTAIPSSVSSGLEGDIVAVSEHSSADGSQRQSQPPVTGATAMNTGDLPTPTPSLTDSFASSQQDIEPLTGSKPASQSEPDVTKGIDSDNSGNVVGEQHVTDMDLQGSEETSRRCSTEETIETETVDADTASPTTSSTAHEGLGQDEHGSPQSPSSPGETSTARPSSVSGVLEGEIVVVSEHSSADVSEIDSQSPVTGPTFMETTDASPPTLSLTVAFASSSEQSVTAVSPQDAVSETVHEYRTGVEAMEAGSLTGSKPAWHDDSNVTLRTEISDSVVGEQPLTAMDLDSPRHSSTEDGSETESVDADSSSAFYQLGHSSFTEELPETTKKYSAEQGNGQVQGSQSNLSAPGVTSTSSPPADTPTLVTHAIAGLATNQALSGSPVEGFASAEDSENSASASETTQESEVTSSSSVSTSEVDELENARSNAEIFKAGASGSPASASRNLSPKDARHDLIESEEQASSSESAGDEEPANASSECLSEEDAVVHDNSAGDSDADTDGGEQAERVRSAITSTSTESPPSLVESDSGTGQPLQGSSPVYASNPVLPHFPVDGAYRPNMEFNFAFVSSAEPPPTLPLPVRTTVPRPLFASAFTAQPPSAFAPFGSSISPWTFPTAASNQSPNASQQITSMHPLPSMAPTLPQGTDFSSQGPAPPILPIQPATDPSTVAQSSTQEADEDTSSLSPMERRILKARKHWDTLVAREREIEAYEEAVKKGRAMGPAPTRLSKSERKTIRARRP